MRKLLNLPTMELKVRSGGVKNGPPYPVCGNKLDKFSENDKIEMDLQMFAKIPEKKFTHYALDPKKSPDKARAFKEALGHTKENFRVLIDNIENHVNKDRLVER